MLEAIHISKSYGSHSALQDFTLTVGPGEVFCLLGANGAGKTTTINIFMGFIESSSGVTRIDGIDVIDMSHNTNQHVAYIPENLNLYGNLSGLENLEYFSGLGGKAPDKSVCKEFLISVGLQRDAINKRVSNYSKGMRQKVGIAIAKAKQAKNLLLDEPTSGLDPKASNEFARLLHDMKEDGVATLMATHDLFRAKESGTHIGIMKEGRLLHTLDSEEITLLELEQLYLETMNA